MEKMNKKTTQQAINAKRNREKKKYVKGLENTITDLRNQLAESECEKHILKIKNESLEQCMVHNET